MHDVQQHRNHNTNQHFWQSSLTHTNIEGDTEQYEKKPYRKLDARAPQIGTLTAGGRQTQNVNT